MTPKLEFCLLGPLVVRRGGVVLPVPRGRQRAVLAVLLLNAGRVVSIGEIAETLWGPAPLPSASVTVRNYVKRLRRVLGDADQARIVTRSPGYVIRVDPGELDVARFEALLEGARNAARGGSWEAAADHARAALALWRGEPLADVESEMLALREVPRGSRRPTRDARSVPPARRQGTRRSVSLMPEVFRRVVRFHSRTRSAAVRAAGIPQITPGQHRRPGLWNRTGPGLTLMRPGCICGSDRG